MNHKELGFFTINKNLFLLDLKPNEFTVFVYLLSLNNYEQIVPSRYTISKRCNIKSLRTVDKILKKLREKKLILQVRRGLKLTNQYKINRKKITTICYSDVNDLNEEVKLTETENDRYAEKIISNFYKLTNDQN